LLRLEIEYDCTFYKAFKPFSHNYTKKQWMPLELFRVEERAEHQNKSSQAAQVFEINKISIEIIAQARESLIKAGAISIKVAQERERERETERKASRAIRFYIMLL
jgi:hypothetical protein